MEKNLNLINNVANLKPVGTNATTGMAIYQSFHAKSGFNYQVGVREARGLHIIEGIAEGTACMFLCGIQVRDKETGKEICSIPVEQNTRYSREVVVGLVHQHLCQAVMEAAQKEGEDLSIEDVEMHVAELLDESYFSESRRAALNWAKRVGIL